MKSYEKKNIHKLLVIGSGLSSLNFAKSYLKRNKNLNIISPQISNSKLNKIDINKNNEHIYKLLPPQMFNAKKKVKAYFYLNKIKINKNCKVFGSLEHGGLSNYWGLQIDKNIKKDIESFSKKTKKQINECFSDLVKDLNLIGTFNYKKKIKDKLFEDEFFKLKEKTIFGNIKVGSPILGFSKKNFNIKSPLRGLNEDKDKLVPKNFTKKFLNKKNIIFHNYFVQSIKKKGKFIAINCENELGKKVFLTKKLVLGSGTITTTKLIMDFLNIKQEVSIKHHPRLFTLYISKKKWLNSLKFLPSPINIQFFKRPFLFKGDFRPGNKLIIDSLVRFKWFLQPIKFLLNYFRQYMIFSNIFLHTKYSNLFIKKSSKGIFQIYSKKGKTKNIFRSISKSVYNFLRKNKKIFPFFLNYFPGYGPDFHYFGTIPYNSKGKLSVNEKSQLKGHKNIFIIDGSVFNFKDNKYPLGIIMANSRRIGKII